VAQQLEADIVRDGWPVGEIYASEDELRQRYGVSRAVLREAIRLIEHHGVATMRRGPYGGLVLRAPDAGPLALAVVVYLEFVGTTVEDLLAVRMLLEPLAARLAAENLTEEHIATLRAALSAEREHGELEPGSRDRLHLVLAGLGGNPALALFIDVLVQLTHRYAKVPPRPSDEAVRELSAASDHAHSAVCDAIIAGNAMLAEHRTVRHLEAIRNWLLSTRQDPIARSSSVVGSDRGKEKLAETVARRLMADIAASGVPAGKIYGSEPELQARFDVSRAVFREAVRLLEYHHVARMRRGPYGGLVVTDPDPAASADAMAVYLDYVKVEADQLRQVREVIELGALDLLTERAGDPEQMSRLRAAHQVSGQTPGDQVGELGHAFHTAIAELSGNPILALFQRIVLAVWARHSTGSATEPADRATAASAVGQAHGKILEAVVDGDAALARHRMHRHLEALEAWWQ
jgi:DNA-binding FadR family transcriptional regulator